MATRLGPLVPMQQSRLEKEKLESNKWTANWVGDPDGTRFEVCHHETRIDVDLQNQSCTCRMWQLTGLPCRHAIVAIRYNNHRLEDYNDVHDYFLLDLMQETIFIPPPMPTAFRPPPLRLLAPIRIIMSDGVSHNKNQPNYMSFIPTPGMPSHQDSNN
ncbi:uncharacterized protein LOC114378796 [Glycine soja]|uniref:uncharacterized protein LOC114378796 n=1 Tax=Glycine soja TaxID=3848 RepID=UPI0003DEA424|nr:uncharacterized protein LOC114378796 [Glycine soja]|eukprot:XP_006593117.1 uncharacterized protein LOC100808984 [Glycine max]